MKKNIIVKILLGLLFTVILSLFNPIPESFDSSLSDLFNKVSGERMPDSSIFIININEEDIEQLGPWPLKRSYYALLIKNLNKYKVQNIGLEIFLSAKFVSQSIYDNVLRKEIVSANNVVLSSLAGHLDKNGNIYRTDSLSLPSIRLVDENIKTGHINYIRDYGIRIPLTISNQNQIESSFCLQLLNKKIEHPKEIKVNFISSWKKFTHYSLLDFFQLVQNNDPILNQLKDKTIIIGVSDQQLSSSITTVFDEKLPGVALHAFALDNILNGTYFNTHFYFASKFLLILTLIIVVLVFRKQINVTRNYALMIIFSLLVFYVLNRFFYIELAYSFLLIPLIVVFLADISLRAIYNKKQLKGFYNEAELLKKLLSQKEKELVNLRNDLNTASDQKSTELKMKIIELQNNISKLKENEDDSKVADITSELNEVNFHGLVYKSVLMKNITELIQKVAPTDATILITGESGTGKELTAQAIHSLSKRNSEKFVAVNCAALTESLLESELFGHVKGAFTGAISDKIGKFEAANKGTIFLDEIGETSDNFQVKLLRVIQSGEYDKVGSEKSSTCDVRVIAATNKDLKKLLNENKFREDLFYRLNVINIHLPALRDRKEDIEPITRYFLGNENKNYLISLSALKALNEYDWKGNIRELESVIKRAKVFCDASNRDLIQMNDLPDELIKSIKLNFEDLVIESLRNKKFSHSSINETAKELGNVNRTLVSENFRGLSFKILAQNNFDKSRTVEIISESENQEVVKRVKSKLDTWLTNLEKDIEKNRLNDLDVIKSKLSSKYKNLPQKFHIYLDELIKYLNQQK